MEIYRTILSKAKPSHFGYDFDRSKKVQLTFLVISFVGGWYRRFEIFEKRLIFQKFFKTDQRIEIG
ncbi:hypothetical protein LEP1GSC058_1908 [Leptospira fainei serovar Hurstbridge str. BUT 6]|uniref:Uncharacterized protein n=1 Tax=Leptospira fainei serovar Hurstbridge str. BUT 6 TaxID=1193011 RepID=S3UXZ7_9LEPT|nr:hypothetical protein LEP1GSC058_1908 [Leptospira fainei serovar Hurstbridge str. BUT 6]